MGHSKGIGPSSQSLDYSKGRNIKKNKPETNQVYFLKYFDMF